MALKARSVVPLSVDQLMSITTSKKFLDLLLYKCLLWLLSSAADMWVSQSVARHKMTCDIFQGAQLLPSSPPFLITVGSQIEILGASKVFSIWWRENLLQEEPNKLFQFLQGSSSFDGNLRTKISNADRFCIC